VLTGGVITARADFVLLDTEDGGLSAPMETPSRSLLLHCDAGPGIGPVALGVLISTPADAALGPGASVAGARLDFWVDLAELYLSPGQQFWLGYPNRPVAHGVITSTMPAENP
jgi:hypothetical protein